MPLLLLSHQLFLIAALDDINQNQYDNHEVEGGFAHCLDGMSKEAEV